MSLTSIALLWAAEPAASSSNVGEANQIGVRLLDHQSAALPESPPIGFRKLYTLPQAHKGQGFQLLEFSPDGKLLATSRCYGNRPCDVLIWDVHARKILHVLPHKQDTGFLYSIGAMAFLPSSDRLVTGCRRQNNVYLWDTQTGKLLDTIDTGGSPFYGVTGLAAFPDGKRVVICVMEGLIVWDMQAKTQTSLRMEEHVPRNPDESRAIPPYCHRVAFCADGTQFATQVNDATFFLPRLLVWDAKTCRVVRAIPLPRESKQMAFSPDGRWLAADYFQWRTQGIDYDTKLGLWEATTGQKPFAGSVFDYKAVYSVAFTRDSKYLLAVGQHDDPEAGMRGGHVQVGVWDVASGKLVNRLERAGTLPSMSIAVSPDNKLLAVPYWGSIDVYAIEYADKPAPTVK